MRLERERHDVSLCVRSEREREREREMRFFFVCDVTEREMTSLCVRSERGDEVFLCV